MHTTAATPHSTDADPSPREVRRMALRDIGEAAAGVVPFGLMMGITVVALDGSAGATVLGAALVFGGSAQLTTTTLLHHGAGLVAALLAGVVVNSRLLLYGVALASRFQEQPRWFRLVAVTVLQDQTYLATVARPRMSPQVFRRYWTWLGVDLLLVWVASVVVGLAVGPLLPPMPHLVLLGGALFVGMLVPRLRDRTSWVAAATAAAVALGVVRVVPELGILGGTAAGLVAALLSDRRGPR